MAQATGIDLDRETTQAVEALVYRLRNRGNTDDEVLALEFIVALKARGWRPTPARPAPDWHYRSHGEAPNASKPGGADYLAEKARIVARAGGRVIKGAVVSDQAAIEATGITRASTDPQESP